MTFNPLRFAEDKLLLEQLRLVLSNFRSTLPVILLPILLFWSLHNPSNTIALGGWCLAVILSHLHLQFFTRKQLSANIQPPQARNIVYMFALLNVLDGVLWGSLSWLTLNSVSQADFILVFAVFAGMLGGGLATQSPVPLLFVAFAAPQALEICTKLWSLGGPIYITASLGSFLYLITLFGQVINSAQATLAAIQVRFELTDSHAKLRKIEHKQTLEQERQRLMQDMHDGLGSSLISALRVVERGKMNEIELALVLKGCIDDLKLAIDSMESVDDNLLLLLANLRFRLGPRLESMDIALIWQVENLPALDWLDPKNALHILRILQETFTNIIKHTGATQVNVATYSKNDYVVVSITDNGPGFDVAKALQSGGKGMSGQRTRAAGMAGTIDWQSSHLGTCMCLSLPIKRAIIA